ncbi:MAG: VTT domain-containing protein [Bacillota bacterium]|nr:DedA family protein [Candidatus Fermentithermobacillaceae bacterium]HAF67435.1 hypothetical protein [Clostridiales bacterium UBA9857]HOA70843.1 VTT domain-containing protein [Bacillota bacterium]HPT36222.1 VTT domain-containing protein [Bacillota bacterium]HPZ85206.1 VTT domain-containing protein [Bacillota bacterium]
MPAAETLDAILEYGQLGLVLLSFCESIFFPIPPDLVLLPMALMNPRLSFWYALLTTSASVAGALAGYAIGRRAGRPLVDKYFAPDKVSRIEILFSKYGGWAVGIAAFTPIPFKLFTLAGGIFRVELWPFVIASAIGRGGRFFLEGALVYFLGDEAMAFLGRNFEMVTVVLAASVLGVAWLANRFRLWEKVRRRASRAGSATPGQTESVVLSQAEPDGPEGLGRQEGQDGQDGLSSKDGQEGCR